MQTEQVFVKCNFPVLLVRGAWLAYRRLFSQKYFVI